jgi:hypothetical protein
MPGLLTPSPHNRSASSLRFARPFLEGLEDRLAPSNLTMAVTYEPNKQVLISGQLTGTSNPANEQINIMGAAQGQCVTDAQGNYSVILTANSLGVVGAVTADGQSNIALATLAVGPAVINNFKAVAQPGGYYQFSGNVSGTAPTQGMVIDFGGLACLQNQTVAVNADGSFCLTIQVPQGQTGMVWAQSVDWWGDPSQDVITTVG